tara:strand:+ start:2648 stop:2851 length:204 start_codon:yes stop_codon:yes gene_type:complete
LYFPDPQNLCPYNTDTFLLQSPDKCFISKGYDATTHFQTTVEDVLEMYTRITGKTLDLSEKEKVEAR